MRTAQSSQYGSHSWSLISKSLKGFKRD